MNYREDIEKIIEYIDENIKHDIKLNDLSESLGYSNYHFSRLFTKHKGISVMQYIRQRRLSLAALDFFNGSKIIDVAFDYQFKTASGFSKAFKKVYGYSPTDYKTKMEGYNHNLDFKDIKKYISKPIFETKESFKVAGYGIKTNISSNSYTKDVASFWSNYEGENIESKLYSKLNPKNHGEIGMSVSVNKNEPNIYLLGVVVNDFNDIERDKHIVEVQSANYAVFKTLPVNTLNDIDQIEFANIIVGTWKYIFEEWFKSSGYIYDQTKLDFEYYDELSHHREDTIMYIYVPIKKEGKYRC